MTKYYTVRWQWRYSGATVQTYASVYIIYTPYNRGVFIKRSRKLFLQNSFIIPCLLFILGMERPVKIVRCIIRGIQPYGHSDIKIMTKYLTNVEKR